MNRAYAIKKAYRGDGTTAMDSVTRASDDMRADYRRASGGNREGPTGVFRTGAAPQVMIETEDFADVHLGITGQLREQVLVVDYDDASANGRKRTYKYGEFVGAGNSSFPAAEGQAGAPRYELRFELHQGSGVTTLAQAVVDAAISGG